MRRRRRVIKKAEPFLFHPEAVMKVIAIANATIELDGCTETEGAIVRQNLPLTRREFLRGSGVLMGTIAAGSTLASLAPSPVWAVELKTLSQAEGATLMKMGRVLYPHAKLPDAVYALLAKDLDGAASGDAKTATMLKEGIAGLNKSGFDKANDAAKLAAVKAIEGTPFFNTVRGKCITSLYDNDMAYAAFGFPGGSFDKGGYITRGFQDLKWLPAPPDDASPKPFMG
jgi:hypothetical protein